MLEDLFSVLVLVSSTRLVLQPLGFGGISVCWVFVECIRRMQPD